MRRTGPRRARLLAAAATLAIALSPALVSTSAEARPGGGSSSGSRGSRTYSAPPSTNTAPGTTSNFNRTETPRGGPQSPAGQNAPGYAGAPARSGFGGFGAGLMGGLLGAGLVGMLFGSGAFGGMAGFAGFLGLLLQVALVAGLVMLAVRFFRRRAATAGGGGMAPAMAGGAPGVHAREMMSNGGGARAGTGGAAVATAPIQVSQGDFAGFERALVDVNAAWSRRDEAALQRLATPEMARYFAKDLQDLEARGWRNETRDVTLESGDLSEAWREGDREYATVAMRFSLVDVTRDGGGKVVEGDAEARRTATELWTFTRRGGGAWVVSAIQQSGR